MGTAKSVGWIIGVLLLVQAVAGALVNFVLLAPVMKAAPGFLVSAAANSLHVSIAAMVGLAAGAISLGIAITAWPVFRQLSERMALGFVALAVVGLSLAAVESASVLSMLSLSQAYANAGAADASVFETLGAGVRSARKWAHYTHLLVESGTLFVLYSLLYRFTLVPRALAAFGLFGVVLQFTALTMPIFGQPMLFQLLTPIGLAHLALALWLITKGLAERQPLPR
ncbi:MAG: DUF4386 family protein [Lysobacter sp.]